MSPVVDAFFSEWLADELFQRGWSQADLARQSGLTRQAISRYINQERMTPDEKALAAIARAFGYSVETVYRAAGLLPPLPEKDANFEDWLYVLEQLPESDRQELLEIARLKIKRQEKERHKEELERARRRKLGTQGT